MTLRRVMRRVMSESWPDRMTTFAKPSITTAIYPGPSKPWVVRSNRTAGARHDPGKSGIVLLRNAFQGLFDNHRTYADRQGSAPLTNLMASSWSHPEARKQGGFGAQNPASVGGRS
jgi:hypothetical protein